MVSDLSKRNLIERNLEGPEPILKIHRALQLFLLFKLDEQPKLRQTAFENALISVRGVFPARSLVTRDSVLNSIWKRYLPQVLSLQTKVENACPAFEPNIEFVELLGDAGGFLYELMLPRNAIAVFHLADKLAQAIFLDDEPAPIRAHIETFLATLEEEQSVENRPSSLKRRRKVVELQERFYAALPVEQTSTEDEVNLARAWNDYGSSLADSGDFEGASQWQWKALASYRRIAPDEAKLRFRFAWQYINLAVTSVAQDRVEEAMEFAERSCKLCDAELEKDDLAAATLGANAAYVFLSCGREQQALEKHKEILQTRIKLSGEDNGDVRTSYYWVGAVSYHMGQLIPAE